MMQVVKLAVDLPFSRKLELEADAVGLRLMAKACYDPKASLQMNAALGRLDTQQQMAHMKYFSTHPPSKERISAIRSQLPEAQRIYEDSDCAQTKHAFDTFV